MDNIKLQLELHHKSLDLKRSLSLTEAINWFFSYHKIDFVAENVQLHKNILQHKQLDRRITAVR